MIRQNKRQLLWGIGLSEMQEKNLTALLKTGQVLRNWDLAEIPSVSDLEEDKPAMALVSATGKNFLGKMEYEGMFHMDLLPKIFILDEGYSCEELEAAVDAGFLDIFRPPFTKKAFTSKLERASEVENIHNDVLCMTKEILLEREILERKNNLLEFLVNFLTNTSESLDVQHIIHTCFSGFSILFPVRSLHAAIWQPRIAGEKGVDLFISMPENHSFYSAWRDILLEDIKQGQSSGYGTQRISRRQNKEELDNNPVSSHLLLLLEQEKEWREAGPEDGHVLHLPIKIGTEQIGVILVLTDMKKSISRDQAMALDSALRHLGLSLKNAQRFQMFKQHATFDGLTGVHNRRYFEERLRDEVERSSRYAQPLSLVFADIDHFKLVNDSKGHQAGDEVLRQVAEILQNTVRNTDDCARYGGEEFVILLPHTTPKAAALLAERMRQNVAEHTFITEAGSLNISISLGLSSIEHLGADSLTRKSTDFSKSCQILLQEADEALYRAKANGRDCVEFGPSCNIELVREN